MAIVLNTNTPNQRVAFFDPNDLLVQVPVQPTLFDALGLFEEVYSSQKTVRIYNSVGTNAFLTDKNYEAGYDTVAGRNMQTLPLEIPSFRAQDSIRPQDVEGILSVSNPQDLLSLESVAAVRVEKMANLRQAHANTLNNARMQLLTTGTVYAPNGTLRTSYGNTVSFYQEFGVTRQSITVNLSGTVDPRTQIYNVLSAIRQAVRRRQGAQPTGYMVACSTTFFQALITNSYVTDTYKYVLGNQGLQILTGGANLDASYPSVTLFGMTFVDAGQDGYDDATGGFVPYLPAGTAIAFPLGVNGVFKTYYAPAQRFSTVNQTSQGSYWFEEANDEIIKIKSEQNFLNATTLPGAIVGLVMA